MNVLITGGTGFIGKVLCKRLLVEGHSLFILTRRPETVTGQGKAISQLSELPESGDASRIDAVINLAGEPIANKRWSAKQKELIISSRLDTTRMLIDYFKEVTHSPSVFISGSAIGYYGTGVSNEELNEGAAGDDSFSSKLCQQWESKALEAQDLGIRTCLLRTGIVLGKDGGALSKMLLPFKLGLGGRIGCGDQWMPWIHVDDLVSIILHCIDNESLSGPVNGTAPSPVTNGAFSRELARALRRPALFPLPAFVVRLLMGEMGEELLLSGKKIVPEKLLHSGFNFHYDSLQAALRNIV